MSKAFPRILSLLVVLAGFPLGSRPVWADVYELVPLTNANWFFNQSSNLDGVDWTAPGYDDSSWQSGPSLLGYEANTAITPLIQTILNAPTTPVDGVAGHACYFRIRFDWPRPTNNVTLRFTCRLDDCAVFYLNGVLLTNDGVTAPVTFASMGRGAIGTGNDADMDEVFTVRPGSLLSGQNVLAVEVHQLSASSSDIVWGARVEGELDTTPPTVIGTLPLWSSTLSSLTGLEVDFSEPVLNVDLADLRINGQLATNLAALDGSRYVFTFPQPATGQVQVAFAPGHGITDLAGYAFAGTNWTYTLDTTQSAQYEIAGTLYVHLAATNPSAATATWTNQGTLGHFTRAGTPAFVQDVLGTGVPGLLFNGTSDYFVGPLPPADVLGANDFSVEAWTLNPDLATEETVFAWGRRGATRINNGLNFGSHLTWGCATYYNDDLGWGTADNVPSAGQWHHLVLTYNGGTLTKMYVDGVMRAQKTLGGTLATEAAYAFEVGCQRNNDGTTFSMFYSGYINSLRVHSGLLADSQIVANFNKGPANAPGSGPAVMVLQPQSVVTSEGSPVSFACLAGGSSPLSYQWYRDGTPIPAATNRNYFLPTVAYPDNGAVFFVRASNVDNGTNYSVVSSNVLLTVLVAADALQHRYSFTTDASDSIGGADGVLQGGATLAAGALLLNGAGAFVDLPNGLLSNSTSATFEAWVTDLGSGNWARVFDFGNSSTGEGAQGNATLDLYLAFPSGFGTLRGGFLNPSLAGSELLVEWPAGRPPVGQKSHLVLTSDGLNKVGRLYVNGLAVGVNSNLNVTPASLGPTVNNWFGKSQWASDAYFNGALDEFRLYNIALSAASVARNYRNGPDQPPANGPVAVAFQPVNQQVNEGQTAVFTADFSGTLPVWIQWFVNDLPVPGATNGSFSLPGTMANSGATVRAWATNVIAQTAYTTSTSNALLTVGPDLLPPLLERAQSASASTVELFFSEPLLASTATTFANYALRGPAGAVAISGAVLDATGRKVTLTTSPLSNGTLYTNTVNNLADRAALTNWIAPNSQAVFLAMPFVYAEVGAPALGGRLLGLTNGLELIAAGQGIGDTNDQFGFASELRTGDFDVQVRVRGLSPTDVWAQAGLMARETLAPGSRFAGAFATPALAGQFFAFRAVTNGPVSLVGSFPPNLPSAWLRLKRAGNDFTGYAGYDGLVWTQLGTTNLAVSNRLFVGYALSSHNAGQTATARFTDNGPTASLTVGVTPNPSEAPGPCTRRTGLVISEIMYRPAPQTAGWNLEFVELYNSNPYFHDLSGHRLGGSIAYTFPPGTILPGGGVLVVAANPADLQAAYGLSGVLGPYSNTLRTTGTVRLHDEQGSVLLEITFSNEHPWPMAADGTGHSIVLTRPSYGENDPRAWDISDVVGGSPGALEAFRPSPLRNVLINEVLANAGAPPAEDFVELYNHSNQSNDLSGCVLTDNPALNRFQVPAGTIVPPRGFLVFTETQLGFGLHAEGDTIYLKNPDGSRVLDAVRFGAQGQGLSLGRFPDGAEAFYPLAAPSPGGANTNRLIHDIVINELMYDPISRSDDDQFVELYNQGTNTVDLDGWQLISGVSFSFPPQTLLRPNSYLVVARNLTNLMAHYTNLTPANTVGNFGGRFSHGGERVVLARPELNFTTNNHGAPVTNLLLVAVDEVTYGTGGRWGQWAAGGGSSLELIDPRADHRLAPNWADSDETAKAPWTNLEFSGTLDNGNNYDPVIGYAQIGLLDPGECLIDNVEIQPTTSGSNYVANPTFEGGLANWALQGCFSRSSLDSGGAGYQSGVALHLRTGNRLFSMANSAQCALNNTTLASGQTATMRFKGRWLCGTPDIAFRLNGAWLEVSGSLTVPHNLGTPGARNSRAVANAGPAITEVTHVPSLPAAGQPCVVVARLSDPDGLGSATLNYRVDPAATYFTVPLRDDGTGGDAVAGDGLYSATIPAQPASNLVAFIITATDALGAATRFPAHLSDNGPDRECLVRFGEPQPTLSFGTYHLWVSQTNVTRWTSLPVLSNEDIDGTLVCGNRVIYNILARYAGSPYHQAFNSPLGPNSSHYNMEVPKDDKYLGHVSFNKLHWIGNDIQDDSGVANNNDATLQREQTANTFLRGLGQPWVYRRYFRLYVNGVQRGQLMEDALRPSVSVPNEYFPNDTGGALYKIQPWFEGGPAASTVVVPITWPWANKSWAYLQNLTTTGGAKKTSRYRWWYEPRQSPTTLNDLTNVFTLIDAAGATGDPNYVSLLQNVADMENWMRLVAANHAAGNWDCFGIQNGQNIYGYVSPQVPWTLYMFDFSIVLGNRISWLPGQNLFAVTPDSWQQMYSNPTFRRMLMRAYKELVNGALVADRINPLLDSKYAAFRANGVTAQDPSVIKDWIASARSGIMTVVAAEDRASFQLAATNFVASGNVALLSGTAPLEITSISVNGEWFAPTWAGGLSWQLRLPVPNGTNQFVVLGYDRAGNLAAGASNQVTVVNPAVPESPLGNVVFNEIMFHPLTPDAEFIELYSRATNTTFDLSGWQVNGLGYSFPPGSTLGPRGYLVLARSRTAFANAYGATVPVFDEYAGSLQGGGETLVLLMPGTPPAPDVILDQVRYEPVRPWPVGSNEVVTGSSIQLLDPAQDNSRPCNWATRFSYEVWAPGYFMPPVTNAGWHFISVTGTNITTQPTIVQIILGQPGEVFLDDIALVSGTNAATGHNYVRNGDFESPLDTTLVTNSWLFSTNYTNSTIFSSLAHGGNGSLQVLCSAYAGVALTRTIIQRVSPAPATKEVCTLSFWFYHTYAATNLTVKVYNTLIATNLILTPSIIPGSNVPPQLLAPMTVTASPGAANPLATNLPPIPPLWLNEVQPQNWSGPTDLFGEHDPWVELFNAGTQAVSLAGLYLADNYTNLTQWAFPADASLAPGQFRLIWLDGQPAQASVGEWHSNFRLAPTNGTVALARVANGAPQVLDYLTYRAVPANSSYGDVPDGQPFYRQIMPHATPAVTNDASHPAATAVINEWMAANNRTLADPSNGQYEDWFELYNPTDLPLDLAGYYLTDTLTNWSQDRIPAGFTVPAHGFLLVWADGAPHFNTTNHPDLHVNFKLAASGEAIGLYARDGLLVDAVTFGPQTADISEGRFPDATGPRYFMTLPTPGASNVLANLPPVLAPIRDHFLYLGETLNFTASATDPEAPPQTLTFSLGPDAPVGATMTGGGLFTWTPERSQAPSTNQFAVQVTDNGVPPMGASQSVTVVVSPAPFLGGLQIVNAASLQFTAATLPGRRYQVLYSDDLASPTWTPLGPPQSATGYQFTFLAERSPGTQRFYRVTPLP